MSFEIRLTDDFSRSAKRLIKKHRSFKDDLSKVISSLSENPNQGTELMPGVRKVRMAITSKGRGKSGGARIITYTIYISEENGSVYLLEIYDKSEYDSVNLDDIKAILVGLGM
jgi:mRNA-degrading endonuclease RelE of RelBE toxin-antitoxin system